MKKKTFKGDQMKYFFALLITNVIGFSAQAADLASDSTPTTVPATFKNLYVPRGFDSNDNIQVAGEGVFSNSCFKIAPPVVSIDESGKKITLAAQAYQYSGMCMQMLIPFQQVVDLGIIKTPGVYKILTAAGVQIGEVDVAAARTSEPDDFFYAPVQRVSFEDGADNTVSLRVEFPTNCLTIGEVRVDKQQNVVVIQPIAKLVRRFGCAMGYFPVTEVIKLGKVNQGRYLLHVRSSGSQANNQIIAIQ